MNRLEVAMHLIAGPDPLHALLAGMVLCIVSALGVSHSKDCGPSRRVITFPAAIAFFAGVLGLGGIIGLLISSRTGAQNAVTAGFNAATALNVMATIAFIVQRRR